MGARHSHASSSSMTTMRPMLAVIILAAMVTVAAMVFLWPSDQPEKLPTGEQRANATVTEVDRQTCPEPSSPEEIPPGADSGPNSCGTATFTLTSGKDKNKRVTSELPTGLGAPKVDVGDDVVVVETSGTDGQTYQIIDEQRGRPLWILGAAFALAVIVFGRLRGLTALVGLVFTFGVLLLFIIPAILAGQPPLPVAIVGSAAIMLFVLYLTHGFSMSTSVAVAGTLVSLTLTGVLAAISASATHLSGVAEESAFYLGLMSGVDLQGLLLAGILIGSLGVLDDVTVTQAATVTELAHANPAYGFRQLYQAAARVGRAHIASVINTIVLAYAGASLPLLLLIAANDQSLGKVLTDQLIAQELVRSIVGTLGLIAAAPITTALAALAASRHQPSKAKGRPPRRTPISRPSPRSERPTAKTWEVGEALTERSPHPRDKW